MTPRVSAYGLEPAISGAAETLNRDAHWSEEPLDHALETNMTTVRF